MVRRVTGSVELLNPSLVGEATGGQLSSAEKAKVRVSQTVSPGPPASESSGLNWVVIGSLLGRCGGTLWPARAEAGPGRGPRGAGGFWRH